MTLEAEVKSALLEYLNVHLAFARTADQNRQHLNIIGEVIAAVESSAADARFAPPLVRRDSTQRRVSAGAVQQYAADLTAVERQWGTILGPLKGPPVPRTNVAGSPDVVRGLWLDYLVVDDAPIVFREVWIPFISATGSIFSTNIDFLHCEFPLGIQADHTKFGRALAIRENTDIGELDFTLTGSPPELRIYDSTIHTLRFGPGLSIKGIDVDGKSAIGVAIISNCKIHGDFVISRSVRILDRCDFRGTAFKSLTVFNGDFGRCPALFDAELSGESVFDQMRLRGKRLGNSSVKGLTNQGVKQQDLLALRDLRIEAQKKRWTREESKFFAEEQRLERALTPWFSSRLVEKCLSYVYDWASCYGASVPRAFLSFFAWNIAFGAVYFLVLAGSCQSSMASVKEGIALAHSPSLALMIQSAANPLALLSEKPLVTVASGSLWTLSLVQTIGSVALFALLLLALRGRFQRGSGGGSVSGS